jgi:Invasion associated locus B (IalB) protein
MMPMTLPPASNLAINRTGDLWELDRHRVYCGNTPDPRVYARLMDGERATTVVTGPPYNVRIDGHVSGLGAVHHRDLVMASGEMDDNEFTDVDQLPPMAAPFITFLANGRMADYEATPDLIGKLKHGEMLTIQAVNVAGAAISFALPLVDFAKANVGPPPIRRCWKSSSRSSRKGSCTTSCRGAPTRPSRRWKGRGCRASCRSEPTRPARSWKARVALRPHRAAE